MLLAVLWGVSVSVADADMCSTQWVSRWLNPWFVLLLSDELSNKK